MGALGSVLTHVTGVQEKPAVRAAIAWNKLFLASAPGITGRTT